MQSQLTRLFNYLQRMIDVVVSNSDGFNDYVAHNLPYQQRTGRIAQKVFNRIVPNFKIEVEDWEMAIKALEESVHSGNGHQGIGGLSAWAFCPSFGNHDHTKVLHILPRCQ